MYVPIFLCVWLNLWVYELLAEMLQHPFVIWLHLCCYKAAIPAVRVLIFTCLLVCKDRQQSFREKGQCFVPLSNWQAFLRFPSGGRWSEPTISWVFRTNCCFCKIILESFKEKLEFLIKSLAFQGVFFNEIYKLLNFWEVLFFVW